MKISINFEKISPKYHVFGSHGNKIEDRNVRDQKYPKKLTFFTKISPRFQHLPINQ